MIGLVVLPDSAMTATHLGGGLWMNIPCLRIVDANVVFRPLGVEDDFLQDSAATALDLEVFSTHTTVCLASDHTLAISDGLLIRLRLLHLAERRFGGRRDRKLY